MDAAMARSRRVSSLRGTGGQFFALRRAGPSGQRVRGEDMALRRLTLTTVPIIRASVEGVEESGQTEMSQDKGSKKGLRGGDWSDKQPWETHLACLYECFPQESRSGRPGDGVPASACGHFSCGWRTRERDRGD